MRPPQVDLAVHGTARPADRTIVANHAPSDCGCLTGQERTPIAAGQGISLRRCRVNTAPVIGGGMTHRGRRYKGGASISVGDPQCRGEPKCPHARRDSSSPASRVLTVSRARCSACSLVRAGARCPSMSAITTPAPRPRRPPQVLPRSPRRAIARLRCAWRLAEVGEDEMGPRSDPPGGRLPHTAHSNHYFDILRHDSSSR